MSFHDRDTIKENSGIIKEIEKFKYSYSLSGTLLNNIPAELINIIEIYVTYGNYMY
jgi:hypothetical protein